MRSIFFGASEYVDPILKLLNSRFNLSLILTTERQGSVIDFAKENNIEYISISKIDDRALEKIRSYKASLGIVADFGIIIDKKVMDIFPRGILNIHPSLLPSYRGPTPVQTALLNGDKQTGVTIIKLDEKMDHGPILAQEEFEVSKENAQELLRISFSLGANLLEKVLIDYVEEVLFPIKQDEKHATYTKLLTKKGGEIDLEKPPSKEKLDRMIRAYFPWPGVWTKTIINHLPAGRQGRSLIIKFLPGNFVQVEGKKPQTLKDFSNGYKEGKEILKKLGLTQG